MWTERPDQPTRALDNGASSGSIVRTWTPINLQDDYSDISSVSLSDEEDETGPVPSTAEQHVRQDGSDSSDGSDIVGLTAEPVDQGYEDDFEPLAPALTEQLIEAMAATAQLHEDNSARMAELRERELRRQSSSLSSGKKTVTERRRSSTVQGAAADKSAWFCRPSKRTGGASHVPAKQHTVPQCQKAVLQQRPLNLAATLPSMIASVTSYTSRHLLHQPCTAAPPRGRLAPHLLQQLATAMEQMQQEAASLHLSTAS